MNDENTTVALSPDLADRLRDRAQSADFDSLDEYLNFILMSLEKQLDSESPANEEEDDVKDRLESLGYL
ncbi:hypothetical protein [Haloferax chudinovii]|uniref:CopG family transcriptional regulator n=1 Tax=Haloferax chudinovii TaxID=1109010 RepID=A0ABD5XNK3_9EURY